MKVILFVACIFLAETSYNRIKFGKGEIRPCDPNPCKYGGSCAADGVLYKCSCIALCFDDDCRECIGRFIVWCVMIGFGYFMTLLLPAKTGILILHGQISTGKTDTLNGQNRTTKEAKTDTTGSAKTDTHAQNAIAKCDTTGTGKIYTASHGQNKSTKTDTSYISQGWKGVTIIDTDPTSYAQKNGTGTAKADTGTTPEIKTAISSQGDNDGKKPGTNSTLTLGEVTVNVPNDRCLMVTSLVIPILGICCFLVAFCFVHPVLEINKLPVEGKLTLNGIGILLAVGLLIYMFWKWQNELSDWLKETKVFRLYKETVGNQRSRTVTPLSKQSVTPN